MAMVANSPMITTTMSSSIRVKPFRDITADPLRAPKGAEPVSPWLGATYSGRRASFLQEPCLPLRIDPIRSHTDTADLRVPLVVSVGIDPIRSHTDTYDQRDAQVGGSLHMAFYQLRGDLLLPTRDLNHKFVMHLQDYAGPEPLLLQGAGNADHRDLDQVRSRPLEGGVGGGPLAKRANVVVAVLELRYVAPPSEQCLDMPPLARLGHRAIEPGPDPGEAGEV